MRRRHAAAGGLVLAALTTAACAHYTPRPLSAEKNASALDARRLDDPGLRDFMSRNAGHSVTPWPVLEWDLPALTLAAFYFHPDLDVARAQWSAAKAGLVTAGARPSPALDAAGQVVRQSELPSPWIAGFSLDVPLEAAHKRAHRVARAQALSEAAHLSLLQAAWEVRSRLRRSLLDLWAAENRLALLERQAEIQADRVQLLTRRLELGEASTPELTRERVALETVRAAARDGEGRLDAGRARVAAAVGVPARALEGVALRFGADEALPSVAVPELRLEALLNRPDIAALLAEYEAAQAALQLEVAKQYPDVRLGPGFTWEQGEHHYVLGLSLPLLFSRNRGPIAEAMARREASGARFTALQARVLGQVDEASAALDAARRSLTSASAALDEEHRRHRQAAAAFAAGERDRLILRGAELELAVAETARLEAVVRLQESVGRLEDAVERPVFDPPVPLVASAADPGRGGRDR